MAEEGKEDGRSNCTWRSVPPVQFSPVINCCASPSPLLRLMSWLHWPRERHKEAKWLEPRPLRPATQVIKGPLSDAYANWSLQKSSSIELATFACSFVMTFDTERRTWDMWAERKEMSRITHASDSATLLPQGLERIVRTDSNEEFNLENQW